jgi:hypothetical protein
MPPATGYDLIGTRQQAIVALLTTRSPYSSRWVPPPLQSFAVILLAWYGIRWIFGGDNTIVGGFAFEGLAVARPCRFESYLPHEPLNY